MHKVGLTALLLLGSNLASVQALPGQDSCAVTPDAKLLEAPLARDIDIEDTSFTGITPPNLWWAKKQFDPFEGKLINDWTIYQNERRIDIVVDRQLWSRLDYMERYRLVNSLGTVARQYQYNFRIFNHQRQCLADYACNYLAVPPQCEISFDSERNGLQFQQSQTKFEEIVFP